MPIGVPSPMWGGIGDALSTLGQSLAQRQAQQQALQLQQQAAQQKAQEFQQQMGLERDRLDQEGAIAGLREGLAQRDKQQQQDEAFAGKAPVTYQGQAPIPLDPNTFNRVQDSSYAPQLQSVQGQLPLASAFGAGSSATPEQTLAHVLTANQSQQQGFDTKVATQKAADIADQTRTQTLKDKQDSDSAIADGVKAYNNFIASNPNGTPEQGLAAYQQGLGGRVPTKPYSDVLPGLAESIAIDKAKASKPATPDPFAGISWDAGGENPKVTDFKKTLDPHTQQFLNQFNPHDQQVITEIANFEYPFPSGMGGMAAFLDPKKPYSKLFDAAQRVNPKVNAQDYAAINNYVTKFYDPNALTGQQSQSASRLMEHMAVQLQNIAKLNNTDGRPMNTLRNMGKTYLEGGDAPLDYTGTNATISGEMNKLWVGAAGSQEGRAAFATLASANAAPEQQYSALYTLLKLMRGQVDTIEGRYAQVVGRPPKSILTPAAQEAQDNLYMNLPAFIKNPGLAYGSK